MRKLLNKRILYLLVLFVICLLGTVIVPTYAKFASNYTTTDDVVGLSLNFNLNISDIEEYEIITIAAGETENFYIQVTNDTGDIVYYGIWYKMVIPDELEDGITIGKLDTSTATTSGSIEADGSTTVPIVINNNTANSIKIAIGVGSSASSLSDIEYLDGKKLITGTANACTLTSTKNYKAYSQTVTVSNLDEGDIAKYYWGTSSTGSPESTTLPTLTADSAGIWYLRFEDTSGNVSGCEITMRSYTVNNMLSKTTGTMGTFNTTNYDQASTYTYIMPNNTSLPLTSIYTIPTGASADTFKGISTGEATTTAVTASNSAVTLSSNATYSMWFNRLTYTVSYDANNGSGAPSSQTKIYGADLTLSSTTPTRTNYNFLGWATTSTATSKEYTAGGTYSNNASVTLYAVWELKSYTISKNTVTGGSITVSSSAKYGSTVTFTTTASSGFSYYGATVVNTSTGATYKTLSSSQKSFTMPASNVTIKPKWKYADLTIIHVGTKTSYDADDFMFGMTGYGGGTFNDWIYETGTSQYFITLYMSGLCRVDILTKSKFDVTHYATLSGYAQIISGNNTSATATFAVGMVSNSTDWIIITNPSVAASQKTLTDGQGATLTVDITSYTGSYYLGWQALGGNSYTGQFWFADLSLKGRVYS